MEDKIVNEKEEIIKGYQKKRLKKKIRLATFGIIIGIIGIAFLVMYNYLNVDLYVKCVENSNLDYKAFLKQNDFYDKEFLEKGTNVVASLLKNIETNFQYNMTFEQEIEYSYDYNIVARIEALEGSDEDILLEKETKLVEKKSKLIKDDKLNINEKLYVDYEYYNDILNSFITTYSLDNTVNRLVLTMNMHIINAYDGTQINENSDVLTIKIPLTTQTVDIGISTNTTENNGHVLISSKESKASIVFLYGGYTLVILAFIELLRFIKYSLDIRSAETMYRQILKRIIFSYKNYIQEINNSINENEYEKLEVSSFNDLIEMRDVINDPILMYKESEYRTKFLIIEDKRIFIYILDANLIREELRRMSKQKNKEKEEKDKNAK